jgi:hypothetical protein
MMHVIGLLAEERKWNAVTIPFYQHQQQDEEIQSS